MATLTINLVDSRTHGELAKVVISDSALGQGLNQPRLEDHIGRVLAAKSIKLKHQLAQETNSRELERFLSQLDAAIILDVATAPMPPPQPSPDSLRACRLEHVIRNIMEYLGMGLTNPEDGQAIKKALDKAKQEAADEAAEAARNQTVKDWAKEVHHLKEEYHRQAQTSENLEKRCERLETELRSCRSELKRVEDERNAYERRLRKA